MLVDHALIERARHGDDEAFGELVLLCRRRVFAAVNRLIARRQDVEDVAQDVFLRLYQSLGQLRTPEAFDFWLYRITTNAVYDYLRKRPRDREIFVSDLEDRQLQAANVSACRQQLRDEQERLRIIEHLDGLLSKLLPADRILLVLREVEGLTMRELSEVYGVREGAIKLRLFRARGRLRQVLNASSESKPAFENDPAWAN
jgi:RNA polymerase sigma-70 factor (ECF subfamily)